MSNPAVRIIQGGTENEIHISTTVQGLAALRELIGKLEERPELQTATATMVSVQVGAVRLVLSTVKNAQDCPGN